MRTLFSLLVTLGLALWLATSNAGEARPLADDPALEARMVELANELRCLVCQNQTIADSNAPLAVDLKNQVREQLRAGRSNQEIIAYMVQRYGDFVLYRPPVKATTAALWYGPFALLAAGAVVVVFTLRRRRATGAPSGNHSEADRQRAAALLADEAENRP
jgi:cytochrome c-type biogenesis protein CcmH